MRLLQPWLLRVACGAGCLPTAAAQSLNVDFYGFHSPPDTYGAVAGQAGPWNVVEFDSGPDLPLVDLDGLPTAATLTVSDAPGWGWAFNDVPDPAEGLMGDSITVFPWSTVPARLEFEGLVDGAYLVWSYGFSGSLHTGGDVLVVGSPDPSVRLGGDDWHWPGRQLYRNTYGRHRVQVVGGQLEVQLFAADAPDTPADEYGRLCGLQLTHLPDGEVLGEVLCFPGTLNGTGEAGQLSAVGSAALADADLTLVAQALPPGRAAVALGALAWQAPRPFAGGVGTLCLAGGATVVSDARVADGRGRATFVLDVPSLPGSAGVLAPGDALTFQVLHRDDQPGPTTNLTLSVTVSFQ